MRFNRPAPHSHCPRTPAGGRLGARLRPHGESTEEATWPAQPAWQTRGGRVGTRRASPCLAGTTSRRPWPNPPRAPHLERNHPAVRDESPASAAPGLAWEHAPRRRAPASGHPGKRRGRLKPPQTQAEWKPGDGGLGRLRRPPRRPARTPPSRAATADRLGHSRPHLRSAAWNAPALASPSPPATPAAPAWGTPPPVAPALAPAAAWTPPAAAPPVAPRTVGSCPCDAPVAVAPTGSHFEDGAQHPGPDRRTRR